MNPIKNYLPDLLLLIIAAALGVITIGLVKYLNLAPESQQVPSVPGMSPTQTAAVSPSTQMLPPQAIQQTEPATEQNQVAQPSQSIPVSQPVPIQMTQPVVPPSRTAQPAQLEPNIVTEQKPAAPPVSSGPSEAQPARVPTLPPTPEDNKTEIAKKFVVQLLNTNPAFWDVNKDKEKFENFFELLKQNTDRGAPNDGNLTSLAHRFVREAAYYIKKQSPNNAQAKEIASLLLNWPHLGNYADAYSRRIIESRGENKKESTSPKVGATFIRS